MGRETNEQDPAEEENLDEGQEQENASKEEGAGESEMDLPTALAKLDEARRTLRDVNRESAGRRKKIKELEDQLKNFTDGGDDTTKKLGKAMDDLQIMGTKLRSYELREKFDVAASTAKVVWANSVAGRDAFMHAEKMLSELPEDATEQDIIDIVKDVVKSRPYLLSKPTPKNINSEEKGKTDIFSTLNLDEIGRDFGIKP